MRRAQNIVGLCLAVAVLCGVLGLWLWGKPRTTVPVPTSGDSPAKVVRTFAKALNDRDYSVAKSIVVGDQVGVDSQWWSLHGPRVEDLQIIRTDSAISGAGCHRPTASSWRTCVEVHTVATLKHVKGAQESAEPGHERWTYYLVRNDSSQRWRILDWDKG